MSSSNSLVLYYSISIFDPNVVLECQIPTTHCLVPSTYPKQGRIGGLKYNSVCVSVDVSECVCALSQASLFFPLFAVKSAIRATWKAKQNQLRHTCPSQRSSYEKASPAYKGIVVAPSRVDG